MKNRMFWIGLYALVWVSLHTGSVWGQTQIAADFDSNGKIDFNDFSQLITGFGNTLDSTAYNAQVDLNSDGVIDGVDAFLFADVFASTSSQNQVTEVIGPNTDTKLKLDPTKNGFLLVLEDAVRIAGYRVVLTLPDTVSIVGVEDLLNIGMLPVRETPSGFEIVGLVLGTEALTDARVLAAVTISGDTTIGSIDTAGVVVNDAVLRGERASLGNDQFRVKRNTLTADQISRIPIGDVSLSNQFLDLGDVRLGDTITRIIRITNTFDEQRVFGSRRPLTFAVDLSDSQLTATPRSFGALSDTTTGLTTGNSKNIEVTYSPTQPGPFSGTVMIRTNRSERDTILVEIRARGQSGISNEVKAFADFDSSGSIDFLDLHGLLSRYATTPDSAKFDLDGDGIIDPKDLFLFADLLGKSIASRGYDSVTVIPGQNQGAAVRAEITGDEITVSVRSLRKLGGYRIGFEFDPEEVAIDAFKDLSQGGGLPIRTLPTGGVVAGLALGEHVSVVQDLALARVTFRALKGQENVTSLVTLNGAIFRGSRGERDSLGVALIGSLGLDVNPRELDFGNVRLGGESQKTFTIFNLGSTAVTFSIDSSDTLVTTKPRSVGNFAPGKTWEVTATYRSMEPGPFASTLTVSTEDTSAAPIQIPVVAFGAVPSISADTLNFGEVFLGRDSTLSVEVINPNLTPFEIQDLVFSGTDTSFTLNSPPDLPLEVAGDGGKQVLEVKYRPLARGTLLDTLRIVGADTTFVVALSGRGIESGVAISTIDLAFGNVIAEKDTTLLLILSNTGNIPYILDSLVLASTDTVFADSVTIDSIFTVVSSPSFPDTLAGAATDTISIKFSPDTTGVVTDTLRIFSADTTFVVIISGEGLPKLVDVGTDLLTVVFGGTIQLNRDLMHFGAVPYGERDSVEFRVENRRSTTVTYRFAATDSQVTVRPDSVENLPPNQSWDVVVVLAPVDSVQTLSQVQITTDDPGDGVIVIRLKSGGSFPSFSDSTLSFGNVGLGLSFIKNVTVTNQGRSNMVVNQLGFVGSDSLFTLASPPSLPFAIAAEGDSLVLSVRFNSSSRGTFNDTLRIVSLDTTVFLPVMGIGRESVVEVVPDSLGFGLVRLGDSITLDLSIENTGGDTVQVLDVTVASGDSTFSVVSLPTLPDTLLPQGGKRTLSIQFTPQLFQPFRDTLRVVIGLDTVQVQLTGTGTKASVALSASELDFGSLAVGKMIRQTLTLTNQGNVPFQIISGDLIQSNPRFSLAGSFPDTVGVSEVLDLVVEFKPDTTGTQIDTLRLVGQDTTLIVALRGVGNPSLTLTYRDDGVTQSGSALDFGNLKAGGTDLRILRISNQKTSALSFAAAGAEGENIGVRPSSLTNFPAGDNWDLQVTWDPTEASSLWTFLQVTADAVETVALARGEVFARVNPDSLAYGNVRVGQDSIQTVSIKNNGLSDLVIQAVGLGDETGFSLVSSLTLPDTLFTRDSLRVRVRFTAVDTALASDSLRITARDTAFAVPLSAQGIQESVSLSTDQLAFGDVAVGADSSLTIRITNIGNGSVILDSLKLVGTDTTFVLTAIPVLSKTLAANGGADSVVVRFRPGDLASFTNTLRFYTGDRTLETVLTGNSTKTLAASSGIQLTFGTTVSLSDSTLDFGNIPTGSSRSLSFSVSNGRDSSLSISVESTNAQVTVTPQSVSGLLNNQSVDVVVTFTPVSLGETSVVLNITTNAPADSTIQLQVLKAPNPLQVTPGVLDFESIAVGEQRNLDVTVINPKGLNFRIQNLILVHAAFSLVAPPALPDTIGPNGDMRVLTVQFAPLQGGSVQDTLNIVGADTTLTVALSGIGIQSQAAATPPALDFGEVTLEADSSQTVTVANSGDAVLVLQSLVFASGDSVFGLGAVPTLPDSVANGESVTYTVTFSPADSGSVLDTLVITARDTIIRVPLSGFGKPLPPVVVEPNPDFDGDGTVGFSDFIIFSGQFGSKADDPGFDAKVDLDSDGEVGFSDFLVFATAFGTTSGKPVGLAKPTSE